MDIVYLKTYYNFSRTIYYIEISSKPLIKTVGDKFYENVNFNSINVDEITGYIIEEKIINYFLNISPQPNISIIIKSCFVKLSLSCLSKNILELIIFDCDNLKSITDIKNTKTISVNHCINFHSIKNIKNIKRILVYDCRLFESIENITFKPNYTSLLYRNNNHFNVIYVINCDCNQNFSVKNLVNIDVFEKERGYIKDIHELRSIYEINLVNCLIGDDILNPDLSPLSECHSVNLSNSYILDISPLKNTLKLNIKGCENINDISMLNNKYLVKPSGEIIK